VATGSACENQGECGISHFLEHLFFKGTPARPVGVMDRQIKSLGGYNNAATSYDFTHYYVVLPSEHAELALEILTDALLNMELPPDEIERERHVVLEEIARKDDSPLGKLYDEFLQRTFAGTPYSRPILGTAESLAGIGRDEFQNYRRRRYGANNLHVVMSGDIDPAKMSDRAKEFLSALPTCESADKGECTVTREKSPIEFEIGKDVQQTYLCLGMQTPPVMGTPDEIALDIAAAVLGDGRSSRLVYRLMERTGLCSSVSAFAWTLDRTGLFGFEACYEAADEAEVRKAIAEEIARIRTEPIPEEEVEKAKTMLITGYAFGLEKTSSMAGVLGRSSACGQLENAIHYEERVRAVSGEEAREAFNRCCPEEGLVTGFVRPEKPS
jgi:zinc protease